MSRELICIKSSRGRRDVVHVLLTINSIAYIYPMSLKKKGSCPFASANRTDVLATTVIKSKIDGRTIPLVLAGRKLKAKAKTNPQNWTHKSRGKSWPIKQLLPAIACKKIS